MIKLEKDRNQDLNRQFDDLREKYKAIEQTLSIKSDIRNKVLDQILSQHNRDCSSKSQLKSHEVEKIKQRIRDTSIKEGLKDKQLIPTEFKDKLSGIKEQENKLYSLIFKEMENKVIMYQKEEQAQMKQ
jgi:hypothetical protein